MTKCCNKNGARRGGAADKHIIKQAAQHQHSHKNRFNSIDKREKRRIKSQE